MRHYLGICGNRGAVLLVTENVCWSTATNPHTDTITKSAIIPQIMSCFPSERFWSLSAFKIKTAKPQKKKRRAIPTTTGISKLTSVKISAMMSPMVAAYATAGNNTKIPLMRGKNNVKRCLFSIVVLLYSNNVGEYIYGIKIVV